MVHPLVMFLESHYHVTIIEHVKPFLLIIKKVLLGEHNCSYFLLHLSSTPKFWSFSFSETFFVVQSKKYKHLRHQISYINYLNNKIIGIVYNLYKFQKKQRRKFMTTCILELREQQSHFVSLKTTKATDIGFIYYCFL